jgi:hypothetical protein
MSNQKVKTNLFAFRNLPKQTEYYAQSLQGLSQNGSDWYAQTTGACKKLTDRGYPSAVAPKSIRKDEDADIITTANENQASQILNRETEAKAKKDTSKGDYPYRKMFEFATRSRIEEDYIQIGNRKYVLKEDLYDDDKYSKEALEFSIRWMDDEPHAIINPCKREMIPLQEDELKVGQTVMGIPKWSDYQVKDIGGKFSETDFSNTPGPRYWELAYGLDVDGDETTVTVETDDGRSYDFPAFGLYHEYDRSKVPMTQRKKASLSPKKRTDVTKQIAAEYFSDIGFSGNTVKLYPKPRSVAELDWKEEELTDRNNFRLEVGNGETTTLYGVLKALNRHGAYGGKKDITITPIAYEGDKDSVQSAVKQIKSIYERNGLGNMEIDDRLECYTRGTETDRFSNVAEQLSMDITGDPNRLPIIVMPDVKHNSEIFYRTRFHFFNKMHAAQNCHIGTMEDFDDPKAVHLALQLYAKAEGEPPWKLEEPADSHVLEDGNSTCYAGFDTSRFHEQQKSASSYSAIVDPKGDIIHSKVTPFGGEKLSAKDISEHIKGLYTSCRNRNGDVKRLVIYRDGPNRRELENWKQAVNKKIDGERSIKEVIEEDDRYPDRLILDLVYVNKTPRERMVYQGRNGYSNLHEGRIYHKGDDRVLYIGSKVDDRKGTSRPMEINYAKRFSIGEVEENKPDMSSLMNEYYSLTTLNWGAVFNSSKSKQALPQKLTQEITKHAARGIQVRDITLI